MAAFQLFSLSPSSHSFRVKFNNASGISPKTRAIQATSKLLWDLDQKVLHTIFLTYPRNQAHIGLIEIVCRDFPVITNSLASFRLGTLKAIGKAVDEIQLVLREKFNLKEVDELLTTRHHIWDGALEDECRAEAWVERFDEFGSLEKAIPAKLTRRSCRRHLKRRGNISVYTIDCALFLEVIVRDGYDGWWIEGGKCKPRTGGQEMEGGGVLVEVPEKAWRGAAADGECA